jgi:hypothetical protein
LPTHGYRKALGIAAATAVACSGLVAGALPATASPPTATPHTAAADPAHPYRHGAVPKRGTHLAATAAATSSNDLNYRGGIDNIGVTTGAEKVYLVFWGSQWGSQSTNSGGLATFSGDPNGAAPYMQGFFKGLGTGGETWSGVMTQYCQGVATGTQICPTSNTQHVGYPTGGALAGVWEDTSASAPSSATGHQIGAEAVKAAAHFGNTTAAANRDAQYVIYSPTGTNPDGWLTGGGFCAWHDWNGDSTLSGGAVTSSYGDIAFTNMPYVTDDSLCGQGFVNSPGILDGFSIVGGHEYAETITDQNPSGGYTDSSRSENGDKCAWISSGQGASQDISLTTGSFAVQSTWANDYNGGAGGCELSHPIVTNGGGGGAGELISAQSGKCLDTSGNTFANGTKEEIWTCNGGAGQTWTSSGGKLTVDSGAYCLDATGGGTADGTKVELWSCNGGQNQQWTINSNGTITEVQSGKCLDVTGAATANGTQVELWTCNGGSNQKWS